VQIRSNEELERLHRAGRGLILNSDGFNVHDASCYFVGGMRTSTRKEWFSSLAELRAVHGEHWSHGCMMCDIGTARVGPPPGGASSARRAAVVVEGASDFTEAVVQGPVGHPPAVSAWANRYVPFEPKHDDQRRLRSELRTRIAGLEAAADQLLHATFMGSLPRGADVENALFYNLDMDGRCFRQSSKRGLRFEHDPSSPADLADGRSFACGYRYALQLRRTDRLAHWSRSSQLASFDGVHIADLGRPGGLADRVWLGLRRVRSESAAERESPDAPFAVELVIHPAQGERPEPARLLKGLLDGTVVALQAHTDQTTLPEVSARLAQRVGIDPEEASELLGDPRGAALGSIPRLVAPWGTTVQWLPGDDKLVAGGVLVAPPSGNDWRLSGEVFAVERRT
jgi:hypothetical protein